MSEKQYRIIEFPIHPDDAHLPLSTIHVRLPSGKLAAITFPIQGGKTIYNALAILEIWKPNIVVSEPEIQSDDLRPTEIYTKFQPIALAATGRGT